MARCLFIVASFQAIVGARNMRVFGLLSRFESDPDFRGRLIPKVCLNVTTAQVELWVKVAFFEVACSDVAHKGR